MKTSFIIHHDSLSIFKKLSDEQIGKLMRAIAYYQITGDVPSMDLITEVAIEPFLNQFRRDDESYLKMVERNRDNGKSGGRPKNPPEPRKPSGLFGFSEEPKKADSDSVNDSESDSISADAEFYLFWNTYDKKTERKVAKRAWDRLSIANKRKAIEAAPKYVNSTPDSKFRKNPATWLNGECWNDELPAGSELPKGQTVRFINVTTSLEGSMPLEKWNTHHANNPVSQLKFIAVC